MRFHELVVEGDIGPRSRANASAVSRRSPERGGVHDERIQVHHAEPPREETAPALDPQIGQGWIPLVAAGTRPPVADAVEVGLTVADQVQEAAGHAGVGTLVGFFLAEGVPGGCVARQCSA